MRKDSRNAAPQFPAQLGTSLEQPFAHSAGVPKSARLASRRHTVWDGLKRLGAPKQTY
jgi:hypothetical protein